MSHDAPTGSGGIFHEPHEDSAGAPLLAAKKVSERVTVEEARTRINYDPDTGKLTWKVAPKQRPALLGRETKSLDGYGYVQVNIRGFVVKGHRLAWLIHYGLWPSGPLDHINGVKTDNRIANLREADIRRNTQNQRKAQSDNKLGVLGVVKTKHGRFTAFIGHSGKSHYVGTYATPEEAHQAYLNEKRLRHAGCTI